MKIQYSLLFLILLVVSCQSVDLENQDQQETFLPANMLDYRGTPSDKNYRNSLVFSDQGAWFGYGFPTETSSFGGFSGPYLLTQENGVWISSVLTQLKLFPENSDSALSWSDFSMERFSYNSHLVQLFENSSLRIVQTLFFTSSTEACFKTEIFNKTEETLRFTPVWSGKLWDTLFSLTQKDNAVFINSENHQTQAVLSPIIDSDVGVNLLDSGYEFLLPEAVVEPHSSENLIFSQQVGFRGDGFSASKSELDSELDFDAAFQKRVFQKELEFDILAHKCNSEFSDSSYLSFLSKAILTLQNNWRSSAGALHHSGLFPSYHYKWFHGFWAWDSWKHAVALSHFNIALAKDQVRAMYDYQMEDGFVPDCIYRDTVSEPNNYRNTKAPLSAWAVWSIYQQDGDLAFLKELYPALKKQHEWWYLYRDCDRDSLCEYGSTDGSLVAAKWESGMDNAVRFDSSSIIKSSANAFSLNQESVDLNAYLFAEKNYLSKIASALGADEESEVFKRNAQQLKIAVQNQFFDSEEGWFFDTSLDGKTFVKHFGCEGWIPLWAEIATPEQALAVRNIMMDSLHFFTKVPFQTLSVSDSKFQPNRGYWRGPNWLDQAYFGVSGLKKYGFYSEANQATKRLFNGAEGLLQAGPSIRENYNPITGEGMESESFSWSAAHYMLLLIDEQ